RHVIFDARLFPVAREAEIALEKMRGAAGNIQPAGVHVNGSVDGLRALQIHGFRGMAAAAAPFSVRANVVPSIPKQQDEDHHKGQDADREPTGNWDEPAALRRVASHIFPRPTKIKMSGQYVLMIGQGWKAGFQLA